MIDEFESNVIKYKNIRLNTFSLQKKLDMIRNYFLENPNIKNVIIGISGGIDSALTLQLLKNAVNDLVDIYPICIDIPSVWPNFDRDLIIKYFPDCIFKTLDQMQIDNYIDLVFPNNTQYTVETLHQSLYAFRYHSMFAIAQNFTISNGNLSIVCGTTNLDEFAYSGWFGKNSDMMVDIQPIIDMHKFEIIEVAKKLGIPNEIINRVPQGDLLDGSSDEDNFGCSFDELAYFSYLMSYFDNTQIIKEIDFGSKMNKLIELHKKNNHKYQGQTFNPKMIVNKDRFFFYNNNT